MLGNCLLKSAVGVFVSALEFAPLLAASPCTAPLTTLALAPSTSLVTASAAMDTPASVDMTIAITNLYGNQLSLSFGLNSGFPPPIGNPQPTVLLDSSSTQYIYPTGWAGRIAIGPDTNPDGSKIEGSYTNGADIDVSYVDGFSVPITCSSQGVAVSGCNIDLFKQPSFTCNHPAGPVCLNLARDLLPHGPPPCFFAACAGAAYTYPYDDLANANANLSASISCCIGTLCAAPLRQSNNKLTSCDSSL